MRAKDLGTGFTRMNDAAPLSLAVITAVAEAGDTEISDLEWTLHDYFDPDILDRLESAGPKQWTFEFLMGPYVVEIDHRGEVSVDVMETVNE